MMRETSVEIWKDIKNFEGLYQISNFGNVKSLSRPVNSVIHKKGFRTTNEKLMSFNYRSGYANVHLNKCGVRKIAAVHRLVCEAFYREMQDFEVVNHLDHCRSNNIVTNLEITTQKGIVNHSKHKMRGMRTKKPHKTNTNEPYVTFREEKNIFRVTILKTERTFSSIDKALSYRNEKLLELGVKL